MLVGFGRRAWAQLASEPLRFAPLTRPVRIPLDTVSAPWQSATFTAEAMAPAVATSPSRRVLISGVLFRRPELPGVPSASLSALCLTCPHEQCRVDLITDPAQLVKISGRPDSDPLFECGCHASVFDASNEGARIAGETPRGLFRFRIASIAGGVAEIREIEEDALSVV